MLAKLHRFAPVHLGPRILRAETAAITALSLVARVLGLRTPVIMVTIPTAWDVVAPMRRHRLVFNRSDRHSDFPEADRASIEALENQLLAHADHVVYVSQALMAEELPRTGHRAHFLDHGVDVDHFVARPEHEWPDDVRSIPGPRIGFFGALDDFVVDFDLLERVAAELPQASLVLIGDATHPMERFAKYPNVHWLGFRRYSLIPAYGSAFDVAIMPWQDNDWIKRSNPIKLKEYLALGLPVVSTDFAELAGYTDRVRVARTHAEFVDALRATLATGPLLPPAALRASVHPHSWHARTRTLLALTTP